VTRKLSRSCAFRAPPEVSHQLENVIKVLKMKSSFNDIINSETPVLVDGRLVRSM
jgi:hypothetical protein